MIAYSKRAKREAKKARASKAAPVTLAPVPMGDEGKPTPERMKKGSYSEGKTLQGVRVYRDANATPLRRAHRHDAKRMTDAMCEAGERYEEDRRIVWGSPSGRSCLDVTPRGADSDPRTEGVARAQVRLYQAEVAVSVAVTAAHGAMDAPRAIDLLRDVCHGHDNMPRIGTRARALLECALAALVEHYGIGVKAWVVGQFEMGRD